MLKWINKKRNTKGFTLVELVVVIAILGIIAAIAVPRFSNIRASSAVKADAATAQQIVAAARIQETETNQKVAELTDIDGTYMEVSELKPQSGGTFVLTGGGSAPYVVTWIPTDSGVYNVVQTVTEGEAFELKDTKGNATVQEESSGK